MTIGGVILAGGLSRRMGGREKALMPLAGRAMIHHIHDRIAPQVSQIAINANGSADRFQMPMVEVLPDPVPDNPGPLAGILAGLDWAVKCRCDWLLTVPADCPFLPTDLVSRLVAATDAQTEIAIARSNGRHHPVIALWHPGIRDALHDCLIRQDIRKIDRFTDRHRTKFVDWPVTDDGDPFDNINTPEDLKRAEIRLQG